MGLQARARRETLAYQAPRWMPHRGLWAGHVHTIWPALCSRAYLASPPQFARHRVNTPDADFVDFDVGLRPGHRDWFSTGPGRVHAAASVDRPLLVLFHGLEGSSRSHYALAFAEWAQQAAWDFVVPHFRGCSGELNLLPRAYHSGDYEEVGWMLAQCRARHRGPIVAVGVSLGGNALLRWAQEAGHDAAKTVQAVAALSAPLDLAAGGRALGQGFNLQVYTRMFLRSMKPRAMQQWARHPGMFDAQTLQRVRNLYEFDACYTAPLHGFESADDYWARASAKPGLSRIRVPALVLNARNDPFVPAHSLPQQSEVGDWVRLWQPDHGGHVGFASGLLPPGHVCDVPAQVMAWLQGAVPIRRPASGRGPAHG